VIAQELEAAGLGCVDDLGLLWVELQLCFLDPLTD
jgi:hypothetical protein